MTEGAELRWRHGHASSQVKHDETLHQRARLENDLPDIIPADGSCLDAARNHIGRHVRRRRPPHPEVFWVLARPLALAEKHQLEQAWVLQGVVQKDVEYFR